MQSNDMINMARIKRLLLVFLILVACVGCDQATKAAARTYLASSPPISMAGGIFLLQYAENSGAFLTSGRRFRATPGSRSSPSSPAPRSWACSSSSWPAGG